MKDFQSYFDYGWHHILNFQNYDHILFILALCGIYTIADWRKVLILLLAFTIGHSTTLALGTLNLVQINSSLITFLIPVTVLLIAISNILNKRPRPKAIKTRYFLSLLCGLVHGISFSDYLKGLLSKGDNIVTELFAFNLGLEFGQIIIVIGILLLTFILLLMIKIKRWDWVFFLSSAVAGISFVMIVERIHILF